MFAKVRNDFEVGGFQIHSIDLHRRQENGRVERMSSIMNKSIWTLLTQTDALQRFWAEYLTVCAIKTLRVARKGGTKKPKELSASGSQVSDSSGFLHSNFGHVIMTRIVKP